MLARGATANLIFEFDTPINFDEIATINLYVVGTKSGVRITKTKENVTFLEDNCIFVRFSQNDTLQFFDNEEVEWHWHWRIGDEDGDAFTSEIETQLVHAFLGDGAI